MQNNFYSPIIVNKAHVLKELDQLTDSGITSLTLNQLSEQFSNNQQFKDQNNQLSEIQNIQFETEKLLIEHFFQK